MTDSTTSDDPFFDVYDRDDPAYGLTPSAELAAFLEQCQPAGRAVDLGAGAGRDTLELARAGLEVLAIDYSPRGLERIVQRARQRGFADRVTTQTSDVRELDLPAGQFNVLSATTVLDHIEMPHAKRLWQQMIAALQPEGTMYVEVHTTDDPGSRVGQGAGSDAPVSETAVHVINHFPPNELLRWALATEDLRVLRYEERGEWDYTHGPEHLHAKAILLATKATAQPQWFGHPVRFPRR